MERDERLPREGPPPVTTDPEALVRTCPNCSAELEVRRCKLVCPRCHYFMSCAEYH
jgi:hypothetical protein